MNYNRSVRCEVCRKFIGYSDFVRGEVTIIKSITTGNESRITYCHSKCLNSPEMISPVIGEAIRVCSDVFDIEAGLVIGRTRQKKAVFARHMAIALSFELFKRNGQRVTYSMVGYEFGRRDHTTVLHSKRTFANLYETDGWFREKADFCRVELGLERTEKLCPDCGKPVQHEMLGRCNGCYALEAVDLHNRIFPAVQELKAELKEKSISLDEYFASKKEKMEFNLEYKLENLKKRAKEFFDENGEAYTGIIISIDFAKEMLEMIKELEDRVIDLESEVSVLANDRP